MRDSNRTLDAQHGGDRFVVVYRPADSVEAHALKNYLASRGKEAFVEGELLTMVQGGVPFGTTAPRVLVETSNAAAARELLADWLSRRQAREAAAGNPPLQFGLLFVLGNVTVLAIAFAVARAAMGPYATAYTANFWTGVIGCLLSGNWIALVYFRRRRRKAFTDT